MRRCNRFVSIGVRRPNSTQRKQPNQRYERGNPEEGDGWRAKEERWRRGQPIVGRHIRRGQSPQGGTDSILVSGSHAGTVGTSRADSTTSTTRGGYGSYVGLRSFVRRHVTPTRPRAPVTSQRRDSSLHARMCRRPHVFVNRLAGDAKSCGRDRLVTAGVEDGLHNERSRQRAAASASSISQPLEVTGAVCEGDDGRTTRVDHESFDSGHELAQVARPRIVLEGVHERVVE